jgi:hypothetical protein
MVNVGKAQRNIKQWLKDTQSKRQAIRNAVDDERHNIGAGINGVKNAEAIYEKIWDTNMIGKTAFYEDNVLRDYFRSSKDKKLMYDEIRSLSCDMFARFEKAPKCDTARFNFIIGYIGDYLNGENARLVNADKLRQEIRPIAKIEAVGRFIESAWFCYVPVCEGEFKKCERRSLTYTVGIDKLSDFNHSKLIGENMTVNDLMDIIASKDEKFAKHVRAELAKLEKK